MLLNLFCIVIIYQQLAVSRMCSCPDLNIHTVCDSFDFLLLAFSGKCLPYFMQRSIYIVHAIWNEGIKCRVLFVFVSFPGEQSHLHVWCRSGSAGRPAVCPVGWGWGPESDMSNSILKMARCASSTLKKPRSVSSMMNAVSLSLCASAHTHLSLLFCKILN